MTGYRLTPRAREGLARIVIYIGARFGPEVAERVLGELSDAFAMLAARPGIGHRRVDLTADDRTRFWPVGPSLIAYRKAAPELEILFVERGDIDWEARLARDQLEP